ncbi:MAG: membrane fusion protein (multidrug efflux system) [Gammaproteobacteria bacterium]|jgi:membrane fusion protein (multidrug efflux system)
MKIKHIRLFAGIFVVIYCFNAYSQEGRMRTEMNNIENIRGLIKPQSRAVLSSEISGRISKIMFKSGERFNKNDQLIKFDCSLYNAELASARARFNAEKKRYENNKKLLELNAISDIEVELSMAEMEIAAAEVTIRNIRTNNCLITAPYSGRVIDIVVNEYESVLQDQELISILDDLTLEIELIVPSSWLIFLKNGVGFNFAVDETGKEYPSRIVQIGATVDPVSQTVRLIGEFDMQSKDVLSGMSGTAIFNL